MKKQGIDEVAKKLEKGVVEVFSSDRYAEYLRFVGKFHHYSANNCLLIMLQCPEATHVAGYRKWQEMKRQVRKGEKAIRILAPVPHKFRKEVTLDDGTKEEREGMWTSFRSVPVFDISQTEGEDVPSLVEELGGSVEGYEELEKRLMDIAPVPVAFDEIEGGARGFYHSGYGVIVVQEGMPEKQTVKTTIHEIAHSMLHSPEGEQKDADSRMREVQAESVAYVVCDQLGIDTSDYSFGYVAGWSSDKEVKELMGSMEVIRRTASEILDKLAA